jgi:hypothetical protein
MAGEIIYDKTDFPSRPESQAANKNPGMVYEKSFQNNPLNLMTEGSKATKEAGQAYGEMIYDRSKSLLPELPEGEEYEPVKAGVVEGTPGGMQYDKTFEDPFSPKVFKVNLGKQENEIYPSMPPGNDTMTFSGVGNFLKGKFEKALDGGGENFTKSLGHYEKVITEGNLFQNSDSGVQDVIRGFFEEAKGLRTREDFSTFWSKVENLLIDAKIDGGRHV